MLLLSNIKNYDLRLNKQFVITDITHHTSIIYLQNENDIDNDNESYTDNENDNESYTDNENYNENENENDNENDTNIDNYNYLLDLPDTVFNYYDHYENSKWKIRDDPFIIKLSTLL